MSLFFHPKVLALLSKYKKTGNKRLLKHILFLLLDNTCRIDLQFIFTVLFSHTNLFTLDSKNMIESIIQKNFVKKDINGTFICFIKSKIPNKIKNLIFENRNSDASHLGNSLNFNYIDELKEASSRFKIKGIKDENINISMLRDNKETEYSLENVNLHNLSNQVTLDLPNSFNCLGSELNIENCSPFSTQKSNNEIPRQQKTTSNSKIEKTQQNKLNFTKISTAKSETVEKFAPLSLKNATFIYNKDSIVYDTQRKRDDLIHPVALQFIKFHDQCKPPIYRKRGLLQRAVFSDRKIPGVLDYEQESSDWEEVENSVTEDTTSEESDEQGDEDWVEKDSEDVEISRYNKKPCFIFQEVQIETFFDKNMFLNANLVISDNFHENLIYDFIEFRKRFKGSDQEMIENFSLYFNITIKGIKEMLENARNLLK